ncbi:thiol peroxidase (atypical 2-Cys peroxiredoxin) [Desulfuromusa kysingii]|uniref:Thiol peroxidase n=1 Tax=Desulfuromusa kysingii TaxID=37625 RepID=A0A1H3WZX2_9BACT|nr:thiol peroxidase [Desulfuromusa kysingii]SDZ92533.1 thiol peroxidase (atypical 2-Cys peroxiredoxin) [Desulfuromusa kysingii]
MSDYQKREAAVLFKGNPSTLLGPEIKVGDSAPDFRVVDNGLQPVTLATDAGKVRLITVVPSLDTPVCDAMTRHFNQDVSSLPDSVVVYTISVDLPFAQKRWCGNAGIDKVQTLSDYQDRSFGLNYGLLLEGLKLLARAVYVIDKNDKVAYVELVPEVTSEPNYVAALEAVKKLL